jgi:cyclophilin family peptidyl-prolyl cis-trans isomerase
MRGYGTPVQTAVKWSNPPPMVIDPAKIYIADFKTAKGEFRVQLLPDKAPKTVNSFVFLAQQGFFNNTTFHRVIKDFMAQGGDPTATGSGGPGYTFDDEIDKDLKFDKPGVMAMANSGPNTNGSQFFITFTPQPDLDGRYAIFGQVVSGMDVLLALKLRDPSTSPNFIGDGLRKPDQPASRPDGYPHPPCPGPDGGRSALRNHVGDRARQSVHRTARHGDRRDPFLPGCDRHHQGQVRFRARCRERPAKREQLRGPGANGILGRLPDQLRLAPRFHPHRGACGFAG